MQPHAHTAGRRKDHRARVGERAEIARFIGLLPDGARRRRDQHPYALGDLLPLEQLCGLPDVVQAPAGAGAEIGLMNGLSDGFGLRHLIDAMRTGDLRGQRGGVKAVLRAEYGVRVTGIDGIVRDAARGEIRLRCFIHRHEADLCSHLNGHICDGHALVH